MNFQNKTLKMAEKQDLDIIKEFWESNENYQSESESDLFIEQLIDSIAKKAIKSFTIEINARNDKDKSMKFSPISLQMRKYFDSRGEETFFNNFAPYFSKLVEEKLDRIFDGKFFSHVSGELIVIVYNPPKTTFHL